MLHEMELFYGVAPPQSVRSVESLGTTVILFNKVRRQPFYIYALVYLSPLESNCNNCKDFCSSMKSLILIIYFEAESSHFHIY